ncbi:hypothetical protein [Mycobacterium sp. 1164966.3]|uniref:hypothetical protein n=1 Tax=Mycobacterium sp. 1164966.3 TaxID=1856861 RepID=UPI0012E72F8C|nr:hypothetical protein [Mycobacterium sp. 1164966.3]
MSVQSTTWKQKRGQLARQSKDLPPGHPKLEELRRDIRAERLAEQAKKVVDASPSLTDAQIDHIAAILRAGRK